ncbi:MAG TPA: DUF2127 domain-containing protein, partial [Geobacteraceae bacterium]|nr:DUF2127 domain-containing protein [Geobacteraceae bacterium]
MKKRFSKSRRGKRSSLTGLKIAALLEAAKGLLVFLTGFGLLAYIHKDLHHAAEELVRHFHLNPASHYPRIFLDLSSRVHDTGLWAMATAAFIYSAIRIAEAAGLWLDKRWAEWFGILSGAIYIPVEIFELYRDVTWPKVTVLVTNAVLIIYLLGHVVTHRHR